MSELSTIVFPFEDVGEDLNLLPLAARRALDHAGYRLSLEGYQSMAPQARRALSALGAQETVDQREVERVVRKSTLPATKIKPVADPDELSPPDQLANALGSRASLLAAAWPKLRPLDRFALVHVMRRAIAHDDPDRLEAAANFILGTGRSSPAPSTKRSERPPALEPQERRSVPPPDRLPPAPALPDLGYEPPPPARTPRSSAPPAPKLESVRPAVRPAMESRPPPGSWAPPPSQISTHLGASGEVHMVDVGGKEESVRRATASGAVRMRVETAQKLSRSEVPKGEVLATARVAGIMAAKRTPELVPLCHHVALTRVEVLIDIEVASGTVMVTAVAEATDRTGVEMEALVAASVACLTIYDMLKGIDRDMVVGDIKLLSKSGGRHGNYVRQGT
jgi:cyclic pyranopterin phosphate synthase